LREGDLKEREEGEGKRRDDHGPSVIFSFLFFSLLFSSLHFTQMMAKGL